MGWWLKCQIGLPALGDKRTLFKKKREQLNQIKYCGFALGVRNRGMIWLQIVEASI